MTRVVNTAPAECVVYALLDAERAVLYVGSSTDLDARLRAHRQRDWWEHVTTVSWVPVSPDRYERWADEGRAIAHLAPQHNQLCNHGLLVAERLAEIRHESIARAKEWPQIKMHQRNAVLPLWIEALAKRRRPLKRYGWLDLTAVAT